MKQWIELTDEQQKAVTTALAYPFAPDEIDWLALATQLMELRFINGRATVELSGGITLSTVREYAEAGPDYISIGAITHSAPAVDINLRIESCN